MEDINKIKQKISVLFHSTDKRYHRISININSNVVAQTQTQTQTQTKTERSQSLLLRQNLQTMAINLEEVDKNGVGDVEP